MSESKARNWIHIYIRFDDGQDIQIDRCDLEKIDEVTNIIDALERAKNISRQLRQILL